MLRFDFCSLTQKRKKGVVVVLIVIISSTISECFISPNINAQPFEG